jgi:hypothetical protein
MLPFKIQTPEQKGVDWLDPALTEKLEASNGIVQGSRTFSYVVKLSEPGQIDLGEVTLPYWDPRRQRYFTARAPLGAIVVKPNPNAKAAPPDNKPIDRLAGVLKAREQLGPFVEPSRPLSDRPGFFGLLLLAPLGVVVAGGALSVAGRAREKLRQRGSSPGAQLEAALREAKARAASDASATVAAAERAVFLAIELKLGFKARAVLKTELAAALTERGVSSERAAALTAILEDCDSLRFVGAASGVDPQELVKRTEAQTSALRGDKLASTS